MKDAAFDTRRRVLRAIQEYPGLHLRELARHAGVSEQLAAYHVDAMVADGLVEQRPDGVFRRLYATTGLQPSLADQPWMDILRKPPILHITLLLAERGAMAHNQIVEEVGSAKSTVSYHLKAMSERGLVVETPEGGFALADGPRVRRLLLRWRPQPTLLDRFADLWTAVYRR